MKKGIFRRIEMVTMDLRGVSFTQTWGSTSVILGKFKDFTKKKKKKDFSPLYWKDYGEQVEARNSEYQE